MKKQIIAHTLEILIFFIPFMIAFTAVILFEKISGVATYRFSNFCLILFCLLYLLLPYLASVMVIQRLSKWFEKRFSLKINWFYKKKSVVIYWISVYIVTVFAGIPSIKKHNLEWSNERYQFVTSVWDVGPKIKSIFIVPILPCVFTSYHEYHLFSTECGIWQIQIWYILGAKNIIEYGIWDESAKKRYNSILKKNGIEKSELNPHGY